MPTKKSRLAASIGPRVGGLGRKRQLTRAGPPKGEHWLAEAERLLNSVVAFAYRAAGSWLHGWLSLFSRSPSRYLLNKEADGQVLSWASVLVATSALAGVLFPVASQGVTPPEWAQAVSGLANAQDYLARSLPILGLGLVLCFVAWLACVLASKRSSVPPTRLLVSTYYALSTITVLLAFALDQLIDAAERAAVLPQGTRIIPSVTWFPVGFIVCFLPLGAATAWAAVRAALRAASRGRSRPAKLAWLSTVPLAGLTIFLPAIVGSTAFALTGVAPALTDYLNPKAFRDQLSEVSVVPLPMSCRTSDAPKESRTFDCLLAAETSGQGVVFVDVGQAALFVSDEPLGEWQQERYRFRTENSVWRFGADKPVSHAFFAEHALGEVTPVNPTHRAEDKVVLEMGKPLAWMLRFNLAKACVDERLKDRMASVEAGGLLYVRIQTLRPRLGRTTNAGEAGTLDTERFEAVGPWELPGSSFTSACENLSR